MYTIILAGGSGTRLFPLSRTTYPKQFIPLLDNDSLFQKSVKRALLYSKIDTTDAVLVCRKNQSQRVGEITSLLKNAGDERADLHTTVHRPCGQYTILLKGTSYLIKRLTIHPGSRLSLQYHHHRSEHWVVVSGTAEVTNDNVTFFVRTGESTFIPSGIKHRLANPGLIPLEVIEVQNGEVLTEADIVRIDDDYQRDNQQF